MGLRGHTRRDNAEKATPADVCRENLMDSSSCYLKFSDRLKSVRTISFGCHWLL